MLGGYRGVRGSSTVPALAARGRRRGRRGAAEASPLPAEPRPLRSRRRKWEVPRAGRRSTPPPEARLPPPPAPPAQVRPDPPPLPPGGAAREVCAGRARGEGAATPGAGVGVGGRGGGAWRGPVRAGRASRPRNRTAPAARWRGGDREVRGAPAGRGGGLSGPRLRRPWPPGAASPIVPFAAVPRSPPITRRSRRRRLAGGRRRDSLDAFDFPPRAAACTPTYLSRSPLDSRGGVACRTLALRFRLPGTEDPRPWALLGQDVCTRGAVMAIWAHFLLGALYYGGN